MEANNFVRPNTPSHLLIPRIMNGSEYVNALMHQAFGLKEQIVQEPDPPTLFRLNKELSAVLDRQSRLSEAVEYILETFRTIPHRSPRLNRAEIYFFQSQFEEMNNLLDPKTIREEVQTLRQSPEHQGDNWQNNPTPHQIALSYELLIKAFFQQALEGGYPWGQTALDYLLEACEIHRNTHTCFAAANIFKETAEYDRVATLFNSADAGLKNLPPEPKLLFQAKLYWAKSVFIRSWGVDSAADKLLSLAVAGYSKLSEINPDEYLHDKANLLTVMADDNLADQKLKIALVQYEEAARIRRRFAINGDYPSMMSLAEVLFKLSGILYLRKEYTEAQALFHETDQILDSLIDQNLYEVIEQRALLYHNKIGYFLQIKQPENALPLAIETLNLRRRVQEINPFGKIPDILDDHKTLAHIYDLLHRPNDSIRETEKAIKLCRTLLNEDPADQFRDDLATLLCNAAETHQTVNNLDKSLEALLEALEIYRQLVPEDYDALGNVALVLGLLSQLYEKKSGFHKEMIAAAKESYNILTTFDRTELLEKTFKDMKRILQANR